MNSLIVTITLITGHLDSFNSMARYLFIYFNFFYLFILIYIWVVNKIVHDPAQHKVGSLGRKNSVATVEHCIMRLERE